MDNLLFAELGSPLSQFDGMAAGTFTDMRGKKVTLNPALFVEYISNTVEVIESTKDSAGNPVGLPIDLDGHDHKGGAGWIVGVSKDPARDVLRFDVNWTDAGRQLIESNTRRFFSATFDPSQKAILGGSLTNWPATRDGLGRILLRPVELSQQLQELDMPDNGNIFEGLLELGREFLAELKGRKQEPPEPKEEIDMPETMNVAEFMQTPEAIAELELRANARAAELLKAEQLKAKVMDFAKAVTSGNSEKPVGLSLKVDDLAASILELADAEKVMDLLGKIWDAKVVDFQERGHSREQHNKQEVPAELKPFIQKWVEAGKKPADFFTANPELGLAADFDLAEFSKE